MATLTTAQIQELWIRNGGNPTFAPIMAAIAKAESGGRTDALNPKAPDYSVGLWQINYYGPLRQSRIARYGSPQDLIADPNAQARAAIDISGNGSNLRPWTTFTSGAYKPFLDQNAIPSLPPLSSQTTPTLRPATTPGDYNDEGTLFDVQPVPLGPHLSMRRSTARKIVGTFVLAGGGVVGLAGLFLLLGGRAPGPAGIVQTYVTGRSGVFREQRRQEGLTMRQDMRAQERRRREAESVAGAMAAEEAF